MLTILHASDLQIGKPYRTWAADAMVRTAEEVRPDVVVIAGDLTQRAKPREYRIAREILERFGDTPVVVTPGNHDVPVYRVWERLLAPYRNWRRYISRDLDSVHRIPGAMIVALNSSAPYRTIVAGRLRPWQVELAREAFATSDEEEVRVLVVHHHFVPTEGGHGGTPIPNAVSYLKAFTEMGVDLILGGHIHQTRVLWSQGEPAWTDAPFPLVACGTTTSGRGRAPELGVNSLNVVRVDRECIEVTPYLLRVREGGFEPETPTRIPRWRMAHERGGADAGRSTEGPRGAL